jgi:uncharacterized protein
LGLTIEDARALYGDADSVHDFDHILRVLALAERIAGVEGADRWVVRTAALLHDWGRAEAQASGRNHAEAAAERARDFLREQGEEELRASAVVHAILAHRFRADPDPETLEAKVLFDADKLDAIGAVGVARAFAYGGAHQQRLWASRDTVDEARWLAEGDDPEQHTPVHEFVVKLSRLKDQLYTGEGRRIAVARHAYMAAFYDQLDAEVRGQR